MNGNLVLELCFVFDAWDDYTCINWYVNRFCAFRTFPPSSLSYFLHTHTHTRLVCKFELKMLKCYLFSFCAHYDPPNFENTTLGYTFDLQMSLIIGFMSVCVCVLFKTIARHRDFLLFWNAFWLVWMQLLQDRICWSTVKSYQKRKMRF